jgi:hypothetical protein
LTIDKSVIFTLFDAVFLTVNPKNMKLTKLFSLLLLLTVVAFTACKPKDSDLQAAISEALKKNPDLAALSVDVKEGVATLSGEVKDEATQKLAEEIAKGIKGVKSVTNSLTLPPPPPVVEVATEDALLKGVKDALKDLPSVTGEVKDSVIVLTGEIKKTELAKLMPVLMSLKPKKVDNKLTVK